MPRRSDPCNVNRHEGPSPTCHGLIASTGKYPTGFTPPRRRAGKRRAPAASPAGAARMDAAAPAAGTMSRSRPHRRHNRSTRARLSAATSCNPKRGKPLRLPLCSTVSTRLPEPRSGLSPAGTAIDPPPRSTIGRVRPSARKSVSAVTTTATSPITPSTCRASISAAGPATARTLVSHRSAVRGSASRNWPRRLFTRPRRRCLAPAVSTDETANTGILSRLSCGRLRSRERPAAVLPALAVPVTTCVRIG